MATTVPTRFGLLLWIWITRYCRPNTEWSCGEKLTRPESVDLAELLHLRRERTPFVDFDRLIAVTTPSIAAGPVM